MGFSTSAAGLAILVGTIVFLAFGYVLHPLWIGVPVFGTAGPGA